MPDVCLTDAEIAAECFPLTQPAAQIRHLRSLGLTVTVRPDGRPRVVRSHFEAVLSGQRPTAVARETPPASGPKPNIEEFRNRLKAKPHGPQKKLQPA